MANKTRVIDLGIANRKHKAPIELKRKWRSTGVTK